MLIVGQNTKNIESLAKDLRLEIVKSDPDVIISFGGDGTLLSAERNYPNILKLPVRNSDFCKKCLNHTDKLILKKLLAGKLKFKEYKKLETTILYKKFYALNDFVVRNSDPTHTIRFKTSISDQLLIGDGIVVSTPFGSTGYFQSITHRSFNKGFGVVFNNTTRKVDPLYLSDKDSITFELIRGKATLSYDNSPDVFTVDEGSKLEFKISSQVAKIYTDTSLRCPSCQILRT